MSPTWGRSYMVCSQSTCSNWIWNDKLRTGTKCRRCGTWWPDTHTHTGKGKGYGRPPTKHHPNQQWLETPPGLTKIRPLKKTKVQQEATALLNGSWSTLPEETQIKLQALGIGPTKPEEPELTDILKTHMDALPPQVQQIVKKLTAPEPCTERDIATKLKGQVTDLMAMSIRKNQLQEKIDGVKAQYASLLSDMQELQAKLADGQKALHKLSQDYMTAINQTPAPGELTGGNGEPEQIPMAVESFVHSLGISLTEEQKNQLHGLLKRPNQDPDDPTKRRKTDGTVAPPPGPCG